MIEIESDWKKNAAQVYSDKDVEKAFLDQAYMFIQNKATPLMKDPYKLGFEIVYKNDANSKMVGIFAFKVGNELIYAPAFFVNGAIKGTDLLYRHKNKTFVPLTNDWAQYLVGIQENKSGTGMDKSESENSRGLNIGKLINPPNYSQGGAKNASYSSFKKVNDWLPEMSEIYREIKAASTEEAVAIIDEIVAGEELKASEDERKKKQQEVLERLGEPVDIDEEKGVAEKKGSLIRKFITEDGGLTSIKQLTNLMQKDATFATAILNHVGLENVLLDEIQEELNKEASVNKDGLTLHMGFLNDNVKEASEKLAKHGFLFEDNRDKTGLTYKVFKDDEREYSGVSESGIYKVLLKDGTTKRCLVVPTNGKSLASTFWNDDDDDAMSERQICGGSRGYGSHTSKYTVVDLESNAVSTVDSKRIITSEREAEKDPSDEDLDKFPDTPTPGNHYVLLDLSKGIKALGNSSTVSDIFYVKSSVGSSKGVNKYKIDWSENSFDKDDNLPTLTLNPDYEENNYRDRVFKKGDVAFVKVDKSESVDLASSADLHNLILGGGKKSASIYSNGDGSYITKSGSNTTSEQSRLSTMCYLMKYGSLAEPLVVDLLDSADKHGKVTFFAPLTKEGHNLNFGEDPESYFTEDVDDIFNISRQSPQSVQLIADSTVPNMPNESRIGDSIKFNDAGELEGKGPNELSAMADELGVPSLFEHGVVGSLANTYDSSMLIDKYFPDLEKALDRLGRMVFLFYWKPEDFSHLYGSDDQSGLENMLVSNFKSFGELVLELLKKIKSFSESTGRTY